MEYKKLELSKEQLTERFLNPYENGAIIVIGGKSIEPDDIEEIKINRTDVDPSTSISQMRAITKGRPPLPNGQFYVTYEDKDITDELILGPPGYKKSDKTKEYSKEKKKVSEYKRVFIVHGHDEGMKQTVARVLDKLDLMPIILHEQSDKSRTIIEKFEDCSEDIPFAIVLLSPDDKGCEANKFPESAKLRTRQNVILELGYFIGKLGRNNVLVLFKKDNDFELPSDILGILFTPFDNGWELKMVQELHSSGYNVDANRLIKGVNSKAK